MGTHRAASTPLNLVVSRLTIVDLHLLNPILLGTLEEVREDARAERPLVLVVEQTAGEVEGDRPELSERNPAASHSRMELMAVDAF